MTVSSGVGDLIQDKIQEASFNVGLHVNCKTVTHLS